jgi:hypothetical protein
MTSSNRLRLLDANNEGVVTEWLDLDQPAADMWRMSACYSWNMMIAFITIFKVSQSVSAVSSSPSSRCARGGEGSSSGRGRVEEPGPWQPWRGLRSSLF